MRSIDSAPSCRQSEAPSHRPSRPNFRQKLKAILPLFADFPQSAAVLLALSGYSNRNGECWPSIKKMARALGMSDSTVKRGVRHLRKVGLVRIIGRTRHGMGINIYLLTLDVAKAITGREV